jgi:hypothetical protein
MTNSRLPAMTLAISALALSFGAQADEDFYGIVESRPASVHAGEWVIGGRSFTATAETEIEADDGPLDIGACASVEMDGERVEEIESEPAEKCAATNGN